MNPPMHLAIQLRYGSLPIPLKIVETRIIGPTLGEDSLQKSLMAGIIGMIIVILFMLLYYRLPGFVADISILFYAAITFAIFKWFHFTLTLPGIAGFLLSTGAALDANILIFERFKEELRNGRSLATAVDQGWTRAWSSIRELEHRHHHYIGHPVLVRQYIRRDHRQRFFPDPGHRRNDQPFHGDLCLSHLAGFCASLLQAG